MYSFVTVPNATKLITTLSPNNASLDMDVSPSSVSGEIPDHVANVAEQITERKCLASGVVFDPTQL
jgi:hypothetical protein